MLRILIEHWWFLAVRAALALALALLGFSMRALVAEHYLAAVALSGIEIFFALFVIAAGAVTMVAALLGMGEEKWWLLLAEGAVAIAAGSFVLFDTTIDFSLLVRIIALWGAGMGLLQCIIAVHLRRHVKDEWFLAISGCGTLIFAAFLFAGGFHTDSDLLMRLSWYALFSGMVMAALAIAMRQALHHARAEGQHSLASVAGKAQTTFPDLKEKIS
jgi:uncharacterized membrane protein HdeD (DUF308 family)